MSIRVLYISMCAMKLMEVDDDNDDDDDGEGEGDGTIKNRSDVIDVYRSNREIKFTI